MNAMHNKKTNTNKKNFYIALGICLIAIGMAAWTTYTNVVKFTSPSENEPNQTISINQADNTKEKPASNNLEGIKEPATVNAQAQKEKDDEKNSKEEKQPDNSVVAPLPGKVVKKYSDSDPLYSNTLKDWRVHTGIDIEAKKGDKVKSMSSGKVVDIYESPELGKTIVIKHDNNLLSYYSGLGNTTMVKKGDEVTSGQDIGSINDIPAESADGEHLHFAIKKGEKWIDPQTILEKNKK